MTSPSSSQIPHVECGCGFAAVGFDEERNAELFDSHMCFDGSTAAPTRWHESVFSAPVMVFLIIAVVVAGIVLEEIFGGK